MRGAYYPLCFGFRCLEDGIRPRSYRGGVGGYLASPKTTGCATCFLRAYAGAPVTRTLRSSLLRCGERPCDTLRALPENTARCRCTARFLFVFCGSGVRGIPPVHWVARGFRVRPVPSELGRGRLSRFSVLPGGWMFCVSGGGCRVLVCCLMASLVRAEASVPSVATSGCPKRSEGGFPCRSEDVHRPSSKPRGSPPPANNESPRIRV